MIRIKNMTHYICKVQVLREGIEQIIESSELVPGDIVYIEENKVLPCDFILLSG